jgi:pimeloyl-ACP methyl ester carboxylesterase
MKNLRKYGKPQYKVALIHGGPGAPGDLATVASELSSSYGVLEPLQTADTVLDQVEELKNILDNQGDQPILLVGHSWGAWLSYIFTAKYPKSVKKLILIASGPFEEKYTEKMMETRLNRLTDEDKIKFFQWNEALNYEYTKNKNKIFALLGQLGFKTDSFAPLELKDDVIEYQYQIYDRVWSEARNLRKSGKLLRLGKKIQCPVVAIHGDYDPHPYNGVKEPFSHILKDFRFVLIKDCGHYPWKEKFAKEEFYDILKKEIKNGLSSNINEK